MKTYYLETLLLFFVSQRDLQYEGVEIILGIIDDPDLDDETKSDAIEFMLRRYGLNETNHKEGAFAPKIDKAVLSPEQMTLPEAQDYQGCFMTQMFLTNLLCGEHLFEITLN
jgi:hypothetical protein